ncbi:hypothetical protein FZC33_13180 [Labrys sp. KNU-23]|uniref:hypothetical protein n=1 Tax=Labrys sp. KNU-23 TaxID=2789216 RepID=UPI0011F061A2|nr:hypothetical protein [Labrys sp. KNU-23]QEN87222.1 hypothetical protein FZC33_13180 [Labrys sp. KNU-23]
MSAKTLDRSIVPATAIRLAGLVVIAFVAGAGLFWQRDYLIPAFTGLTIGETLRTVVYLCIVIHLWISVYDGVFTKWRQYSWFFLVLGLLWLELADILGFVFPVGLVKAWLPEFLRFLPAALSEAVRNGGLMTLLAFPVLALALDLALMHGPVLQQSFNAGLCRQSCLRLLSIVLLLVGGFAAGVLVALVRGRPISALQPFDLLAAQHILPNESFLSFYAILRSVPNKLGGVIVIFMAVIVPLVVPWLVSGRYRWQPMRPWFQLVCALLALCWASLSLVGTEVPEEGVIWLSRGLAAYYFTFFVVILPLFAVWARRLAKKNEVAVTSSFD